MSDNQTTSASATKDDAPRSESATVTKDGDQTSESVTKDDDQTHLNLSQKMVFTKYSRHTLPSCRQGRHLAGIINSPPGDPQIPIIVQYNTKHVRVVQRPASVIKDGVLLFM
jgi:hypothetical protein